MQNLKAMLVAGFLVHTVVTTGVCANVGAQDRPLFPSSGPAATAAKTNAATASTALTALSAEGNEVDLASGLASGLASESASASALDTTSDQPARGSKTLLGSVARPSASDGTLAASASKGFMGELLPTAAALGGTLLVIVLARSAVKRFGNKFTGGKRPSGVVEILARYPVARAQNIVLVKVGRRVLVAHQGAQGMQTLSEFSSPEDVADILSRVEAGTRGSSEFSFDSLLRQSGKAFESSEASTGRAEKLAAFDPRDSLPPELRNAQIERVDLTRRGRGGAR